MKGILNRIAVVTFIAILAQAFTTSSVVAQCTLNGSTANINISLLANTENGNGTITYEWIVSNDEQGLGNRITNMYFEIGNATYTNAATQVATWNKSVSTAPGYNALLFSHVSGTTLYRGAVEGFSYILSEPIVPIRVRTVEHSGHAYDLTFDLTNCGTVLPVELTRFDALLNGTDALLQWETASETNNAGFEVQLLTTSQADWKTVSFVEGHGTTEEGQTYRHTLYSLAPGSYTFRLKQVDYDGTFEYSPEVEVDVAMVDTFAMEDAYPNPFNPQAQFSFSVRQQQQVAIELFDLQGRRVKVLYSGTASEGQTETVRIDGSDLPSGQYLVRALGSNFSKTQKVTLIK